MNTTEKLKAINNLLLQKAFIVNYENVSEYLSEVYDLEKYSKRSFLRDIQGIKVAIGLRYPTLEDDLGSLLKFIKYKNRYVYVRDDISAYPSLSEKELNQIASSIEFNRHLFTGGTGEGLVNKLRAISLENTLTESNSVLPWPAIQLIKDGQRAGSDQLQKLIECIASKKIIQLEHKGISKTSKAKLITGLPLLIKEYNNGWYTGWYLLFQEIDVSDKLISPSISKFRLLALDRINLVRESELKLKVKLPSKFDPTDYFKYCFGIIRNNISNPNLNHEHIVIKLEPKNWILPYLIKYPLHFSQKVKVINNETSESMVELDIEINDELISFIMKYAESMTVLAPITLKNEIINRLTRSLNNYSIATQ